MWLRLVSANTLIVSSQCISTTFIIDRKQISQANLFKEMLVSCMMGTGIQYVWVP